MAILPIAKLGNPVLRKLAEPVSEEELVGQEFQKLMERVENSRDQFTAPLDITEKRLNEYANQTRQAGFYKVHALDEYGPILISLIILFCAIFQLDIHLGIGTLEFRPLLTS